MLIRLVVPLASVLIGSGARAQAPPSPLTSANYEDGPNADTSHRGAVRELIAVAGLRARLRFRDGQLTHATDDVLAAVMAARHLSVDRSLASVLIAHALELGAASLLAQHIPELPAADLLQMAARLDALPAGMTFADSSDFLPGRTTSLDTEARGLYISTTLYI